MPLLEELFPLLALHWQEIAHFKDIALNPLVERYLALEAAGALRVFVARHEGRAVGYEIVVVQTNMHYSDSLQAVQDVLFIHPDYRGRGMELISYCDEVLRAEGVEVVYQHVKFKHDFGRLLERMGYKPVDKIYARDLREKKTDKSEDSNG